MPANLTYSIFEGVLTGLIGGRIIHIRALSGGGGGSTAHRANASTNNPYMESLKTSKPGASGGHVHGGPIPPGKYAVSTPAHHPHLGLSARLVHPHLKPAGRDGFYIHGRGPHGSDGCIVPVNAAEFNQLMTALTKSNGGTLFVQETLDGSRFA